MGVGCRPGGVSGGSVQIVGLTGLVTWSELSHSRRRLSTREPELYPDTDGDPSPQSRTQPIALHNATGAWAKGLPAFRTGFSFLFF